MREITAAGDDTGRYSRLLLRRLATLAMLPMLIAALLLFALLGREQVRIQDLHARLQADNGALRLAMRAADAPDALALLRVEPLPEDAVRLEVMGADGRILLSRRGPAPLPDALPTQVSRRIDTDAASPTLLLTWNDRAGRSESNQRLLHTGMLLAGSLLFILAMGWLAASRALAPLGQLASAIEGIGRGEQVQVPVRNDSVLARLQHGINEASSHLARARNRMESELGRTSVELADRNMRLEAASLARARFLAAASHDLRQPLYALTLFSSALRAGEQDPVRLTRIRRIEECVASLDQLFSELLDLSRLEAGAMQPTIAAVELDGVFAETSRNFRILAESRGLRLIVRKTDAWVTADRTMLARILNNLISNALRYTAEGGVLVGVRRAPAGRVRIDVWDTGRGIAPEHQQRVFDEFYQVPPDASSHAEQRRGMGLGLSTVRRLAELIDCRIQLASRTGRGTRIRLELDAAQAVTAAVPALADIELPLDVSGLRVLVIDDEPSILEGLRALLTEWGCDVLAAEDEPGALAQLDRWSSPPDLVVSDLRLRDGRTGLDVMAALARRYQASANAPPFARLLVTGETKVSRLSEVAASRIPVLFKPVSPAKLREAMLAAVFLSRGRDEKGA